MEEEGILIEHVGVLDVWGVYIFLFDPTPTPHPPGAGGGYGMVWTHIMLGKKNDWNGIKKGGEMHIFSPIDKKYAYFFPNW